MIFHENRQLADDSHERSYLFFCKPGKMSKNLSSAAVVIAALRVNTYFADVFVANMSSAQYVCCIFQMHSNLFKHGGKHYEP